MKNEYFHRVQAQTATSFWINNVTRQEAELAIEGGAVGCTQPPFFPNKMLSCQDEEELIYTYGGLLTPFSKTKSMTTRLKLSYKKRR
jgi:hypothetical protein